jgi:hypothetical protein
LMLTGTSLRVWSASFKETGVLFGLLLKTTNSMHKRNLCHRPADKVNQGK